MNRVATIPLQRTMSDAIQRSQQKLAVTQLQLASGKKATDLAALGPEAVRNLSTRTLVAAQEAHGVVTTRLSTTLSFYDANISSIEEAGQALSQSIMEAVGTNQSTGLKQAIDDAFTQIRTALNASQGGLPLFAGSQTEEPFRPKNVKEALSTSPEDAFGNDDVRASARVADNLDLEYGVTARDLGSGLLQAFRTLAAAGEIGDMPTDQQRAALDQAGDELRSALSSVREINGEVGRKQAQVETLGVRAEQRTLLLKDIISRNEDADLGQVAINLAQEKATLQASYSVFGQLSSLSLASFLR
ncbi:flagellar hook-associated protein 3 FlgL [Sphingomonas sp. OV641]|uniref:flagellin n=1 Tax=Sphingomonas sp. OV641 TaxID=1881068 RepID=UPI0008CE658F|nr:flagellin [Sphingomonas sp. OV641]SEI77930.1 flagellar hook-associated protein 3 FlgL [Sphingomonas sp. OV641]